ncbi:MAG: hypothetical protein ACI9V8_001297, partial [Urechidicola sp.]
WFVRAIPSTARKINGVARRQSNDLSIRGKLAM